jgi:hypothetical protein
MDCTSIANASTQTPLEATDELRKQLRLAGQAVGCSALFGSVCVDRVSLFANQSAVDKIQEVSDGIALIL